MKIGMNLFLWLVRLEKKDFSLLKTLKETGFDGVEIPISDYSSAEIKDIRNALNDEGLDCTTVSLLTEETNPISDDASIRQAALDKIQSDIECAAALGAEAVCGPIHSAHKLFCSRGPNQAEFDRCVEFLKKAGVWAEKANLYLGVEPLNRFECYFLNTMDQGRKLADAVDSPNVGILYDTHHAHIEENNIDEAIRSLDKRINHVHISESHRGTPGSGNVDWSANFETLKATNYDGWIVIEAFAQDVPGFPDVVNIWRNCFANKEEVYTKGISLIREHLS